MWLPIPDGVAEIRYIHPDKGIDVGLTRELLAASGLVAAVGPGSDSDSGSGSGSGSGEPNAPQQIVPTRRRSPFISGLRLPRCSRLLSINYAR